MNRFQRDVSIDLRINLRINLRVVGIPFSLTYPLHDHGTPLTASGYTNVSAGTNWGASPALLFYSLYDMQF
jgi:hypothetical protein